MNLSVGRRTWEEATSPFAVHLAQKYEQAWRDSGESGERPVPELFLADKARGSDGPGTRLALLRADMALRWEAGEKAGAQWYVDRYPDLGEDTIVALVYEEYCLREEDQEHPDPAEYLARFPQVAIELGRVLEIHGLIGSGTGTSLSLSPDPGGTRTCDRVFPEAGQTIGGFSLVEELGRGAFGRVFLARERQLADRPVALKVTARGSREPQTLARLQHTHIVPVHSHRIDEATGLHLLCMPYFGRITLARVLCDPEVQCSDSDSGGVLVDALDRLDRSQALPDRLSTGRAALLKRTYAGAIAWWGARLAEALDHAHDRGVLHRDIKPSNVLVTADGMPMLLDFNLAREPVLEDGTAAGPSTLGGTIDYMAPEHLQALAEGWSDKVDGRSDIYGLGTVLYEALIGHRPFDSPRKGASVMEALLRAAEERRRIVPPLRECRPDIPPALEAVIRHCLEPEAAHRYQRAGELAVDLQAVADDQPLVHAREPWASRAAGWLRRKRRRMAVAGGVLAAAVALGLAGLFVAAETYDNETVVYNEWTAGTEALERAQFVAAFTHFDAIEKLSDRIDLSLWDRLARVRSFSDSWHKLLNWLKGPRIDLEDIRERAKYKAALAERTILYRGDADAVSQAADGLRFRLLFGEGSDLSRASGDLQVVLTPFSVFEKRNWADDDEKRYGPLTLLDASRRTRLKLEANELLFLWMSATDTLLALADNEKPGAVGADPEFIAKAVGVCDIALDFVDTRGPWLALKSLLESRQSTGQRAAVRALCGAGTMFPGEPRNVSDENSAVACFEWGLLYYREQRYVRATDWLRRAVRLKPDDYWYAAFLAILEDKQGLLDDAVGHYSVAVALKPDSPWLLYNRARLYRAKGRWDWAIKDLQDAAEAFVALFESKKPGLPPRSELSRVHLELGYLHQELGDFARASAEYKKVVASDRQGEFAFAARLNQAAMDVASGAIDRAFEAYAELLALEPKDPQDVLYSRALLELQLGQAARALADLTTLLNAPAELRPGEKGPKLRHRDDVLGARALAHLLLQRNAQAVVDASEAKRLRSSPAHERLLQRALLAARRYDLLQLDRPEDIALLPVGGRPLRADLKAAAAGLAEIGRSSKADVFRSSLTRAVVLAALGQHDEAIAAASAALLDSPSAPRAYLIRARARFFCGDRAGARMDIQRGLEIQHDEPGLLELHGALLAKDGDLEGALDVFNTLIAQGASSRIHLVKAAALAKTDPERALSEWSLALRGDPELPEAFLGRARAEIQLGQWNAALADLEQAASWAHSDPGIELKIVCAYGLCLADHPDRFRRWLALAGRTAGDVWRVLSERAKSEAGAP